MLKGISNIFLKLLGWKLNPYLPEEKKFILIAAPHTSNWDFLFGVLFLKAAGVKFNWVGKHTLFKWPLGIFMRSLGGIPIDRRVQENSIQRLATAIKEADEMVIGIAPEGTRKLTKGWKTGFYYIAKEAEVPLALGYMDYKQKEVGIGRMLTLSDNICNDMMVIRDFYKDKEGMHPEKQSEIQVKDCQ